MMPAQPSRKMGAPPAGAMMEGEEGMEAGSTTLPIASYPELQEAQEGQKVMLEGTVQSNDGENVTIGYDMVKLQVNRADQAMQQMTGKKSAPAQVPVEDEE